MKKLKRKTRSKSGHRTRKGLVYFWVAVILLLLISTTGLALDIGKVVVVAHQLQNVADAAALAGARIIKINQSIGIQNAIDTALENSVDGQSFQLDESDIVIGRYQFDTGEFIPTTTQGVNALKVTARRTDASPDGPINLNFGSIFNIDTYNVSRSAIAIAAGGTGAGMISLAPDGVGLLINGELSLIVNDGAILVNSYAENAVRIIGQPDLGAAELDVTGSVLATGGFEFDPNFVVNMGVPPSPDPLCPYPPDECLPEPTYDPVYDLAPSPGDTITVSSGTAEFEPGYYSGGFRINGGDVTFKPGIYILDGSANGQASGLVIGGNANVCAKGVMFYVINDAVVDITGSGNVEMTPIIYDSNDFCDDSYEYPSDVDYAYEQIGIFQSRTNYNAANIVGTSNLDLDGTLYFPNNHIDLSGTGEGFGEQLIADTIGISGTGDMTIMYNGGNRAPANRAYLVE
ncbi:MAG: hypothetical protein JW806_07685 [Sedimentisphaerales bacterium]|nr:hypothetical protein [Sedimentisphaerales bacterium]